VQAILDSIASIAGQVGPAAFVASFLLALFLRPLAFLLLRLGVSVRVLNRLSPLAWLVTYLTHDYFVGDNPEPGIGGAIYGVPARST
jgi:hypothetical protein